MKPPTKIKQNNFFQKEEEKEGNIEDDEGEEEKRTYKELINSMKDCMDKKHSKIEKEQQNSPEETMIEDES